MQIALTSEDLSVLLFQIAIVIFPSSEELNARKAKRFEQMGKEVPPDAVNEMIGITLL